MQHFTNENADQFFEHGLSIPSRTIYMGSSAIEKEGESGVDFRMAEKVLKALHILNELSHDPIDIVMNNIGGDVYHGLAIFDAIKNSAAPVRIFVYGHAHSMGSWILQAASFRVMSLHSSMLLHYGEIGFEGNELDLIKFAAERNRINEIMEDTYLTIMHKKRKNYSFADLKQMLSRDTYLTAHEALELGLIDGVIE